MPQPRFAAFVHEMRRRCLAQVNQSHLTRGLPGHLVRRGGAVRSFPSSPPTPVGQRPREDEAHVACSPIPSLEIGFRCSHVGARAATPTFFSTRSRVKLWNFCPPRKNPKIIKMIFGRKKTRPKYYNNWAKIFFFTSFAHMQHSLHMTLHVACCGGVPPLPNFFFMCIEYAGKKNKNPR